MLLWTAISPSMDLNGNLAGVDQLIRFDVLFGNMVDQGLEMRNGYPIALCGE